MDRPLEDEPTSTNHEHNSSSVMEVDMGGNMTNANANAPNSALTSAVHNILSFPLSLFHFLFSILQIFGNSSFFETTSEENQILQDMPNMQQNLQRNVTSCSTKQEKIGDDIDDLQRRLKALEERRKERLQRES